ncbi:MarR family winged helix-turn-helix transcriptional regulator [Streptomyces sp. NA04227]|uniref:MarR family winged helix-turn-helix transcriptional regulator n=1 Tax=Streptomyces sp. NA04227 TaxID=2742136 RepID=UPI0020CA8CC8|nr:MarR family winged helix-turn-helix transcriptional regulator [Streptomyces sp. NA04227]
MQTGPAGQRATAPPADPDCRGASSAARCGEVSHAVTRVARLHRATAGRLLRQAGIYPGQELVMMLLWERGTMRQSELIRSVELDPSTVTKMLQRLEQSGHVSRHSCTDDRRAVMVEATASSRALLSAVQAAWERLEDITLGGLEPDERAQLLALLGRVEANLCAQTEEDGAKCPGTGGS